MSTEDSGKWLSQRTLSLAGTGMELLGSVLVFLLVGYWIDRHFGTEPWGIVICSAIGIVGGLYNLIRKEMKAVLSPPKHRDKQSGNGSGGRKRE
jgi:ATP synthase protein I